MWAAPRRMAVATKKTVLDPTIVGKGQFESSSSRRDGSLLSSSSSSSPPCSTRGGRRSHALVPILLMVLALSAISTQQSLYIVRQVSVFMPDRKSLAEAGFLPVLVVSHTQPRQELDDEQHDIKREAPSLRGRVSSDNTEMDRFEVNTNQNTTTPESSKVAPEHPVEEGQQPARAAREIQHSTESVTELRDDPLWSQQGRAELLTEQQQQEPEEKLALTNERKKPRFILHVGPMKTGTSSLQADLDWLLGDQLEQDGWMYIKDESRFNLIPTDDPEIFLQMFKEEADKLLSLKKNVIRSREQYSDYFSERPWMYERLKEILVDWDVEVLAGYRTYDGWLVSFYYQAYRMPFSDHRMPEERTKNPWRKDNGELFSIEPLFPSFFNFWKDRKRFTDAVVESAGPVFPVTIFDIHSPKGARSAFLCDALGEGALPITCAESMRMDRENPPLEVNKSNVKELQYDAIALGAASKGMVDENQFRRSEVIDAIVARHEGELQRAVSDFPLICPEDSTYQEFWNVTLARDKLCRPEKYKTDPDYESKFREKFDRSVETKKYCRVHVDAVLADEDWQRFFAKYAPPQAVERVGNPPAEVA